jgi:DNA-binding transcriptional MerR regulator
MNRITTKTLRHYGDIGLLKPAHIDELSGYRYYSSQQLPRLNKIIALKQMGVALKDIQKIIDDENSIEVLLDIKEKELEKLIREEKSKLLSLKNYKKRVRGEIMYNPIIKSLPEVIVASMRFIAESYDSYFDIIPKMGVEMNRLGAVCAEPAYCFNLYHDGEYKESNIDVEVCESVVDYCEDSDMVTFKKIAGVDKALCVLHKGPYASLPDAYNFMMEWIKDNHYDIVGLPRESYIDGIWNKEDEAEWLTEIQIPITRP